MKTNTEKTSTLKILLVEDTVVVQKIHTAILEKLNCSVDLAVDGNQALEKAFNGQNYDLIFMDIGLPDMTGIEVMQKIREKETNQVPIVVLTAFSDEETIVESKEAGAEAVYVKPIKMSDFQKILGTYIQH